MDTFNQIVPPHLNAEVYRTDTTGNGIVSYLDYIKQHTDGSILIGSSELTGRYWDGGASIFKNITEATNIKDQDKRTIDLTSGTADGCFIDNSNKVLLCEDSGAVSIWSINSDQAWPIWSEEKTFSEHDGIAISVDCLNPGIEYVTVGTEGNAKVWDLSAQICLRTYEAHTMPIYALSVRPKSENTFATGSCDQYISMWDSDTRKPVLDIFRNDCNICSMQWLDENKLIFGDDAGILKLVDIRNTTEVHKLTEFPARVHNLVINSINNKVAVCCDNSIVSVCEVAEDLKCSTVYHDRHMHSSFVRGLAWDVREPDTLHTVGYNSTVKTHTIP